MTNLQFGKYRGKNFLWLMENDVGYATMLMADHGKMRETCQGVGDPQLGKPVWVQIPVNAIVYPSNSTGTMCLPLFTYNVFTSVNYNAFTSVYLKFLRKYIYQRPGKSHYQSDNKSG